MATYLFNLVDSAWTGYSHLFDALPYGDPYVSVATLFAVVAMTAKTLASGWK